MLGMEIRTAVAAYVNDRILATRQAQSHLVANNKTGGVVKGGYQNVSVIRANSMKHMPNFFAKGQVCASYLAMYSRSVCSVTWCTVGWFADEDET
jgi:tRNA G46 methylase TrmB